MRKPRDCCAQLSTYARPFVSPLLIPHPWSGPEMCVSSTNGTTWDCGDSAIVQLVVVEVELAAVYLVCLHMWTDNSIGYTSRCLRVILAQGPYGLP